MHDFDKCVSCDKLKSPQELDYSFYDDAIICEECRDATIKERKAEREAKNKRCPICGSDADCHPDCQPERQRVI